MTWAKGQRAQYALLRRRMRELDRRAAEDQLARRMLAGVLAVRTGRTFYRLLKALQAIDLPLDGLWLEEARRVLAIVEDSLAASRAGWKPSPGPDRPTVNDRPN